MRKRIIPCLLLKDQGLVKTTEFKDPVYLGDPVNIVRIFNDKEVDEIVLLDIGASREGRSPQFEIIERICSECFAPVGYGGGVHDPREITKLFRIGVEKVIIGTEAACNPGVVTTAARDFGSQSIVVAVDVCRGPDGQYHVFVKGGTLATGRDPIEYAIMMAARGAGELLLTSIERDGTRRGYDLDLVRAVAASVDIPVVACGGAGVNGDLVQAIKAGASAAAAGSLFVFSGRRRAVLISYPTADELDRLFANG